MNKIFASSILLAALALVTPVAFAIDIKTIPGGENNPVIVPQFPDKLTLDGDLAKWANITALPALWSRKQAGAVKLAWKDDGLYGSIHVATDKINVDNSHPWEGDAIEIWLDEGAVHADAMGPTTSQIAFVPNPSSGDGPATVIVPSGSIAVAAITAVWKKVPDGYVVEFCIPAKELKASTMAPGTRFGFNYCIDKEGKPTEQFFCDKNIETGYATPSAWGYLQLGK
jgi:hypothetical protein